MRIQSCHPELFIGITSWNSEFFLGYCIDSAIHTTRNVDVQIMVLDNDSSDRSGALVRERGIDLISKPCNQGDALNELVNRSKSRYTLLIHADVIFLSPDWFNFCKASLKNNIIMVSPEDIGCGPLTRPFGKNKPESSFLFFDTKKLLKTRIFRSRKMGPLPILSRLIDFYGPHITHRLPQRLSDHGYAWQPMNILYSDRLENPVYRPSFTPDIWCEELEYLRYGLGNFYSLDGTITHYHNWYDRIQKMVLTDCRTTTEANGRGFPMDFIRSYSKRFLRDYELGQLILPDLTPVPREPKAL